MRSSLYIIANKPSKDLGGWRINDENIVFLFCSPADIVPILVISGVLTRKKSKKAEMLQLGDDGRLHPRKLHTAFIDNKSS